MTEKERGGAERSASRIREKHRDREALPAEGAQEERKGPGVPPPPTRKLLPNSTWKRRSPELMSLSQPA